MLLATTSLGLASSTTPPELTAAEAAALPGRYVHVRANVVRVYTARTGYTFLNLDHPRPGCELEVVVKPELTSKLSTAPSQLTGRVVLVQGYVHAAKGSTAQIWLDRAPALSVAAP